MAWYSNMITPLRVLINDFSDSPQYTDDTLKKILVVSASYVQMEVMLPNAYTLDFDTPNISPDPSDDHIFNSFVVMKSACMTNVWNFNSEAIARGIRARLGPVDMEVSQSAPSILVSLIKDGFCKTYEDMQMQYNFGNTGIFRGILSPFAHSEYTTLPEPRRSNT